MFGGQLGHPPAGLAGDGDAAAALRDDLADFFQEHGGSVKIEVWSAREGEQRFDNHVDKLLNYIRFWQAWPAG